MDTEQQHNNQSQPVDAPARQSAPKPKSKVAKGMSTVFSGEPLSREKVSRHYPIMLYCAFLILLYIAYVFNYQRLQRIEMARRIELQEERSRALVFESMRMNASRHSVVMEQIERRGLNIEESVTPPKVIKKQ